MNHTQIKFSAQSEQTLVTIYDSLRLVNNSKIVWIGEAKKRISHAVLNDNLTCKLGTVTLSINLLDDKNSDILLIESLTRNT